MESIPFGDTPFPNQSHQSSSDNDSEEEDDAAEDNHSKRRRVDLDDYFMTDKDKQDAQLQLDPQQLFRLKSRLQFCSHLKRPLCVLQQLSLLLREHVLQLRLRP